MYIRKLKESRKAVSFVQKNIRYFNRAAQIRASFQGNVSIYIYILIRNC